MTKKYSYYLNILLIVIITSSITFFVVSYVDHHTMTQIKTTTDSLAVTEQNHETTVIRWESIIASISGLFLFLIKWWYEKKKEPPQKLIQYNNNKHPIFSMINEMLLTEIRDMDLGTEGRTALFKVMLIEQLKAYEEEARKFLNSTFESNTDFREKARMLILTAVEKYEERWRTSEIPELIIARYKLLHADKIKLLLADVDTIAFYRLEANAGNHTEVTFYLFTHIIAILKLAVSIDTLKTLKGLNGEVKGIKYKGKDL